jgi:nucleoside-diphosphate-sugar epimerase
MKKKYLVLGATGSMGYAFTIELLQKGIETDILVRNKKKAEQLFNKNPLLKIHTGDVTDNDLLMSISRDKDVIFHGINYPYQYWDIHMKPVTAKVIEAASQNRATILFPGNVYAYGNISEPISEKTIAIPGTRKGRLRYELETMLQAAASNETCRIINLRLPDFWGPNVTNGLIKPLFGNATQGKPMQWMIQADIPHQFVYTPDAAKLFFLLTNDSQLPSYYLINYGGRVFSSLAEFAGKISSIAGSPNKLKLISRPVLTVIGWFVPLVRELKENLYQFTNSIILDDSMMRTKYPEFKETELDDAISETISWIRFNLIT